jgi:hypothetical protein
MGTYIKQDLQLPKDLINKLGKISKKMGKGMQPLVYEAALEYFADMNPDEALRVVLDYMANRIKQFRSSSRSRSKSRAKRKRAKAKKFRKVAQRVAPFDIRDKKAMQSLCRKFHDVGPRTVSEWIKIAAAENIFANYLTDGHTKLGKSIIIGKLFSRVLGKTYHVGRAKYKFACDKKKYEFVKV